MLQLTFSWTLTPQGLLSFTDTTPDYNAGSAPNGYGGPNPARSAVQLAALVGQQQPGTYRFNATVYALPGTHLQFQLPGDGLFQLYVFAVPIFFGSSLPVLNAGEVRAMPDGTLIYGSGYNRELVLTQYSFEQVRDFKPALVVLADFVTQVTQTASLENAVDRLLLEYTRQASRNRPQGGEDYAQRWIQAQATLKSVGTLTRQGRYPEAASQLAALQQLLGVSLQPSLGLAPRSTDWVTEQTI